MFLVGPNGSGKSNFLDAFRFVSESLRTSLDSAMQERGGIGDVRRNRPEPFPVDHLSIRFDFHLPSGGTGFYGLVIRPISWSAGTFEVSTEVCRLFSDGASAEHHYRVETGQVEMSSFPTGPAAFPDRLYLVAASGLPEFRPVYDALSRMEIYNFSPAKVREIRKPDPSKVLRRDGSNAASIFWNLPQKTRALIDEYLSRVVPGLKMIGPERQHLGTEGVMEFLETVKGRSLRFSASSMSDGTLRALCILLGLFQATDSERERPLLLGIEEPEIALHPAALHVLLSALKEGAQHAQILVTSHSPDLLDSPSIQTDSLLAVDNEEGVTKIGPIDKAGRNALKKQLFTAGELLRLDQLAPDRHRLDEVADQPTPKLFELGDD